MIAAARLLPSGARFFKCALQVNPHHYSDTFRGQAIGGDPDAHARAIVDKAVEIGVSVLAVTDHNDVSGVATFRKAANGRDITVLPGFELATNEGIHVLCIYPPDATEEHLGRFLGELGIRGTKPSATLSDKSFVDILEKVLEQGGITVAAHATTSSGLFDVLKGQSRINAWRNENLLAIQIPGSIDDLPQDFRQIVAGKDPNYIRNHPAGGGQAVAVVNARDIATPDDLADGSATCWIKMSQITIEGLRQAFLDPDSRIRLNSAPEPDEHAELVALSWEGGFLDGAAIHFNQNLNVLVGGRGAGKSTVIESLRYVLDLEPIGEEARKAHQGLVSHVLRSATKISIRVRAHRPARLEYQIERTIPNPPIVRDDQGRILNLRPKDILPRIEVYGQHEIAELTRSPEKLTSLLSRFVERDEQLDRRKASVLRDLEQTRRSLLDVGIELQQIDERMSALPGLEDTLRRFQEAGLEDRLRERSLLVREERVIEAVPERVRVFRECLETIRQALPIDRVFLSAKALEELPGRDILADANQVLERLSGEMQRAVQQIKVALERADEGIDGIRGRWNERKGDVETAYQRILRELQQSAVDGEELIRLRGEIEGLRPLRERRILLQRLESERLDQRRALLTEWEEVKAREFRLLSEATRTVNSKLRGSVQVEVTAAGNREPLFQMLRDEIGGRLTEAIARIREASDYSLPEFVKRCRDGAEAVREKYQVPLVQAGLLASAAPEALMRIEELELPPTTLIQLNTAPTEDPSDWHELDDLSTGQRATAVLLLLLLESDAPLVVDQPEDDLDNRFITDGVVPRMREEKRRRQFIFSTHNANIPVLGDAELILGLTPLGEAAAGRANIQPDHMGSIDASPVRALVEEVLEGGKTAFEIRRLKYGF